jgi:hypothetical protein
MPMPIEVGEIWRVSKVFDRRDLRSSAKRLTGGQSLGRFRMANWMD